MFELGRLAEAVGGRVEGDASIWVEGLKTLADAGPRDLTFVTSPRYAGEASASRAGILLVDEKTAVPGKTLLRHADPYFALSRLIPLFYPEPQDEPEDRLISARAVLHPTARVWPGAFIGPRVTLAAGVKVHPGAVLLRDIAVDEGTVLHPNATVYPRVRIGKRCVIHGGAVLGADGFGFAFHEGRYFKIPQVGGVVLEDDVEVGANTCVDAGTLAPTVIGEGTKLDDLVMIAHNVRVGKHSVLVGQVGIAGSTTIGDHAVFAGQAGAVGHIRIGKGVKVTAKTGVSKDVPDGAMVSGFPSRDHRQWLKEQAALARLPGIIDRIRKGAKDAED
jgi:UDP-3-O-[3-hydroxymyristoyl] glucosamine N-acyltransferase